MENKEMMNMPDEENTSFDGLSGDEMNGDVPYDDAGIDSEDDRNDAWYEDPNAKASDSPRVRRLLDKLTADDSDGEQAQQEPDMAINDTPPNPLSGDTSFLASEDGRGRRDGTPETRQIRTGA